MTDIDQIKARLVHLGVPQSQVDDCPDSGTLLALSTPAQHLTTAPSRTDPDRSHPPSGPQQPSSSPSDPPRMDEPAVKSVDPELLVPAPLRVLLRWLDQHPAYRSCWKVEAPVREVESLYAAIEQGSLAIDPNENVGAVVGALLRYLKSFPDGLITGRAKELMVEAKGSTAGVECALRALSVDPTRLACCTMLFRHWHNTGLPPELIAERVFTALARTANAQDFLAMLTGVTLCIAKFEELFSRVPAKPGSIAPQQFWLHGKDLSPRSSARGGRTDLDEALSAATERGNGRGAVQNDRRVAVLPRLESSREARAAEAQERRQSQLSEKEQVPASSSCEEQLLQAATLALSDVETAAQQVSRLADQDAIEAELEEAAAALAEVEAVEAETKEEEERVNAMLAWEERQARAAEQMLADREFVSESLRRHYGVVLPSPSPQMEADMQWVQRSLERHQPSLSSPTEQHQHPEEYLSVEVHKPAPVTQAPPSPAGVSSEARLKTWRKELVKELVNLSRPTPGKPKTQLAEVLVGTPEGQRKELLELIGEEDKTNVDDNQLWQASAALRRALADERASLMKRKA